MNSTRLRPPLRDMVDDDLPERDVRRMWAQIAAAERAPVARSSLSILALGVFALFAVFAWRFQPDAPEAIHLANHRDFPAVVVTTSETSVPLDDGSSISIARASRVELLENTGKAFSVALRAGRVVFAVLPGG